MAAKVRFISRDWKEDFELKLDEFNRALETVSGNAVHVYLPDAGDSDQVTLVISDTAMTENEVQAEYNAWIGAEIEE